MRYRSGLKQNTQCADTALTLHVVLIAAASPVAMLFVQLSLQYHTNIAEAAGLSGAGSHGGHSWLGCSNLIATQRCLLLAINAGESAGGSSGTSVGPISTHLAELDWSSVSPQVRRQQCRAHFHNLQFIYTAAALAPAAIRARAWAFLNLMKQQLSVSANSLARATCLTHCARTLQAGHQARLKALKNRKQPLRTTPMARTGVASKGILPGLVTFIAPLDAAAARVVYALDGRLGIINLSDPTALPGLVSELAAPLHVGDVTGLSVNSKTK
jgi:hypothetical protein